MAKWQSEGNNETTVSNNQVGIQKAKKKKRERDETDSANRKQIQMKALKIRKKPKMMSE